MPDTANRLKLPFRGHDVVNEIRILAGLRVVSRCVA